MSKDIYLVLTYVKDGSADKSVDYPAINYPNKKDILEASNKYSYCLLNAYAFRDENSANIIAGRLQEMSFSGESVILQKKSLEPTDDELKDNDNVYLVYAYEEIELLNPIVFQDEINAEITRDALRKSKSLLHVMRKVPVSESLSLNYAGNLTKDPVYYDSIVREKKTLKSF